MKLYIKEKEFTWGDRFTVRDEYGNDKYIVVRPSDRLHPQGMDDLGRQL